MMLAWVLLMCAPQVCAQYYGARCPCPPQVQPPIPPRRPCPPPIPCPPLTTSCPPVPGGPRVYPSYSTHLLSPAYPTLQGRGYGYALPQPYPYYLRENELSSLERQIKTIEVADEKARKSPFDTADVTPVKSVETAPQTRIVSSHVPHIYTSPSESPAHPFRGVGPMGLPPSLPSGCIPGYVMGPQVQPPSYYIPVPEPAAPLHHFPSPFHATLNDCCIRCGTRCQYRSRRNLRNYDDKTKNTTLDETKCTEEKLHDIMTAAINGNVESSKREIQKLAEEAFSGDFHVICSSEDFSYITRKCTLAKDGGFECDQQQPSTSFYFDTRTGACQPFQYLGCGGNENRFATSIGCRRECNDETIRLLKESSVDASQSLINYESICNISFSAYSKRKPKKCMKKSCREGYKCIDEYCCPSKEMICSQIYDSGHELSGMNMKHFPRYAYNKQFRKCNRFSYFGGAGNFNNFPDWQTCMNFCAD